MTVMQRVPGSVLVWQLNDTKQRLFSSGQCSTRKYQILGAF